MGSPKALLPYPENDGTESTFLDHLLKVVGSSQAKPVVVVLGQRPDDAAVDHGPSKPKPEAAHVAR